MRYLFLTNYYPPHSMGGYEQWCQEVAEALMQRGHEVCVLTSTVPPDAEPNHVPYTSDCEVSRASHPIVYRCLHLEVVGGLMETVVRLSATRKQLEDENVQVVEELIRAFRPDAALIWGMWNVPRTVPAAVESLLPGKVSYYICDYWLALPNAYVQRWQEEARHGMAQKAKQLLGLAFLQQLQNEAPVGLALEHPICVSNAVRSLLVEAGVPARHAQVIHGGTQIDSFVAAASQANLHSNTTAALSADNETLRLVYGGRLVADKGVHTILRAMAHVQVAQTQTTQATQIQADQAPSGVPHGLPSGSGLTAEITLDIYGSGDETYIAYLQTLVQEHGLGEVVSFHGAVSRSAMPQVLVQYDAFVFSSEWQEPFARSVLEAMAAGLTVIGTTTGGTGEILVEDETGLTYPAGDAEHLSQQLVRLQTDRKLLNRLAHNGQQIVDQHFRFERMVGDLEAVLVELGEKPSLQDGRPQAGGPITTGQVETGQIETGQVKTISTTQLQVEA